MPYLEPQMVTASLDPQVPISEKVKLDQRFSTFSPSSFMDSRNMPSYFSERPRSWGKRTKTHLKPQESVHQGRPQGRGKSKLPIFISYHNKTKGPSQALPGATASPRNAVELIQVPMGRFYPQSSLSESGYFCLSCPQHWE